MNMIEYSFKCFSDRKVTSEAKILNARKNCFWTITENPYKILWGCRTCVCRAFLQPSSSDRALSKPAWSSTSVTSESLYCAYPQLRRAIKALCSFFICLESCNGCKNSGGFLWGFRPLQELPVLRPFSADKHSSYLWLILHSLSFDMRCQGKVWHCGMIHIHRCTVQTEIWSKLITGPTGPD